MTDTVTDSVACRLCGEPLTRTFVDLGMSPPCESFLRADQIDSGETFYPLNVRICDNCLLVQLPAYVAADDVFSDYLYFSSYSTSWVEHARRFVVDMQERLQLNENSLIVEAASNDGYLLQHAVAEGIPVLGIEPAANIAKIANEKGIRTESYFLGEATGTDAAQRYGKADLVVGNNVFAHVPDIVDFAKGLRALVKDDGLVSLEFPHLLQLIENRQYDTIYHEHYSYLTLKTAADALNRAGLTVVDVQELQSHGGSLRVFSTPTATAGEPTELVGKVLQDEEDAGLHSVEGHLGFAAEVFKIKSDLLEFLIQAQRDGKFVAGYGAPGKGNTLLNHCGIREDLLPYTVDRSPHKHGMFLPGTHIPIHAPERLAETRPDYIVILPWNLRAEIVHQLGYAREWGAKFVVPIPRLEVI
ncbi:methyltransferase family protein [Kribbella sp. VKM Ac-2569]|uniref:class I SAM-dependent methyltransferase n=1 Tax=Kribbella sp. VKM Ac-2569 TaxID=2512220 RepID=UPI00102BBCDF|nr:class I SAM-dependent methyltransferase [Kribbella sp. VKM Ac-2569]RZT26862.1 methyltransferase family protein [Kribbella sp. VKM Ac-2569]